MLCPRCGAYSPYNTPVCNRCGTNLLGKKAGKSPLHSRSERYYRRIRKSDWEQNRDRLIARVNDSLDGIMADRTKRLRLFLAVGGAVLIIILSVTGCTACACGGCGGSGDSSGTPAETPPVSSSHSDSPFGAGALFGEEETVSEADISPTDTAPSDNDRTPFGAGALFGKEDTSAADQP